MLLKLEDVAGEAWMDVAPTGQTWRTLDNLKLPGRSRYSERYKII